VFVIKLLFRRQHDFLPDTDAAQMENYFNDGSAFAAAANRRKIVLKKNAERFKQEAESNCLALFGKIDELN
jgi:hypothetical protein